jgi:hypothetical protein
MPATAFVWARVGRLDLAPLLFCHLPDAPTAQAKLLWRNMPDVRG